MVDGIALQVMGKVVRVVPTGGGAEELRRAVETAWDRCIELAVDAGQASTSPDVEVEVFLDQDAEVVAAAKARGAVAGSTELQVMDALTTRLVQEGLKLQVGDRWLLHACALADRETGATVVLVARSGTGKTTASRTLAQDWGYVTDETSVIERDGTMTNFPKPLSLLVDGRRPKQQLSPTELGMSPAPARPWLAAVGLLSRDPEVEGVRVEQVPMVEALVELAEQTSSLHLLEQPLQTVAHLLSERGGLRRLVYAESSDLAPVLAEWLADARPLATARPETANPETVNA